MKALLAIALLTVVGTSAEAKNSSQPPPKDGVAVLKRGLDGMINAATPPGQSKRPVDPDQGDENASDRAIQVVCTKDTPAAQRAAICPPPISP